MENEGWDKILILNINIAKFKLIEEHLKHFKNILNWILTEK